MTATETGLRDLFVELPLALFEALRGAGEQAMRNATSSTPAPKLSSLSLALDGLRDSGRRNTEWLKRFFGDQMFRAEQMQRMFDPPVVLDPDGA